MSPLACELRTTMGRHPGRPAQPPRRALREVLATAQMNHATVREERPIRAGVLAGSVSAVVAALSSLPLHSPDDPLLNSATVTFGTLLVGLAAGALWRALARYTARPRLFAVIWALGLGLVVLVAAVGETQLDRFASFVVPLAAIVFPLIGIPTAVLASRPAASRWWLVVVALLIAVAVGIGLAGQGDQKSGRLSLPPRASLSAPAPRGTQATQLGQGESMRDTVFAMVMGSEVL